MAITLKELQTLADHYCFNIDEARSLLGKEVKKRGRPSKKDTDSDDEAPKKQPVSNKPKSPRVKGRMRLCSGRSAPPKRWSRLGPR